MRRLAGMLVLAALCAAPAHAQDAPPLGGDTFGTVVFDTIGLPGDHAAAYRRLHDMGVRAIRLDFTWSYIESTRGHYDWSYQQGEVEAARAAGLQVIGLLCCGNKLYSTLGAAADQTPIGSGGGLPPFQIGSSGLFPPDDPADYARFAAAAAAHFQGLVGAWEIWNEENDGYRFWEPHEDPPAYGRLLCAAHDAIRAVDAQTPVLFGGVFYPAVPTDNPAAAADAPDAPGMSGPDFVRGAYAADPQVGRCYDAMAYHPYPYPFTAPELDVPIRGSVLAAADGMRSAMGSDRAKPLWITEVGWPTHAETYGVNELKQAQYTARMAAATFAEGVPVLTYYTYGDWADPTGGADQEAWFGFFRPDGSPKPAVAALSTLTHTLSGTHFDGDLSAQLGMPAGQNMSGGRGFALRFAGNGRTVTAVWLADESSAEGQGGLPDGGTVTPATQAVRVPVTGADATIVDMLGDERVAQAVGGAVTVQAGASPQYIVQTS